jgi:hypothetical protein
MTSIDHIGQIAAGWADAANIHAARMADPELADSPAHLALFQLEMNKISNAYQLAARTVQNLHREDQLLQELLRDA